MKTNSLMLRLLAVGGLTGFFLGCSLMIGSLDECEADADCAELGENLVCRDKLCVSSGETPEETPDASTDAGDAGDGGPDANGLPLDPRCKQLGAASGKIKIGVVVPKTKAPPTGGEEIRGVLREKAIQLAVDQLNPPIRTGIRGESIQLLSCDTASTTSVAVELAEHLFNQGVVAILTGGSAETLAIAAKAVPRNILVMSFSATSPELTNYPDAPPDGGTAGLLWRTAGNDAFQGKVIAQELTNPDGGPSPKVAAIAINDPYGQGLFSAFSAAYAGQSQAFYYSAPASGQQVNVDTAIQQAEAYDPDVALAIVQQSAHTPVVLNSAASQVNLQNVPWFFTDSSKSSSVWSAQTEGQLQGQKGTAPASGSASSPAYVWFNNQFQTTYSTSPTGASFTFNSFDAAMLIAVASHYAMAPGRVLNGATLAQGLTQFSAVSDGGLAVSLDPSKLNTIANELNAGRLLNVEGASGLLDFNNSTGDAPTNVEVWKWVDGGFQTVKIVSP